MGVMTSRITDSPEVTQFRAIATAFCNLVRQPQLVEIAKFLTGLEKLLPSLCHAVQLLPSIERCPLYQGKWSSTKWKRLFVKLRDYLGKYDSYCHVYWPYDPDKIKPSIGSLADDLADICRDLSPGLTAWRHAGATKRRAIVDDWHMNYRIHWGDHAATAWRAIHWLVHFYDVGTEDESFKGHRIKQWERKVRKRGRAILSARNQQGKPCSDA